MSRSSEGRHSSNRLTRRRPLPCRLFFIPAVPPGRRGNLVRDFLISRGWEEFSRREKMGERWPKSLPRSILRIRPRRFASSRHVEDSEQQLTHEYAIKRPFAPAAARVWQTSVRARARPIGWSFILD